MKIVEALQQAISDMKALSPEELRTELDKHKTGTLAKALMEAQEFLYSAEFDYLYGEKE